MKLFIGFIALLFAVGTFAESEYYVWVDENGVTNFAEKNPQGYEARQIGRGQRYEEDVARTTQPRGRRPGAVPEPEPEPEPTPQNTTATGVPGSDNGVNPDELVAQEKAAIAAKIAETKRANCEIGKRNLAQLESYSRIRVKDDSGQERVLSEDERQGQINEARQIVRDNCTG